MLIGAQLYSVRDKANTPEGLHETFRVMKEIGYESVQISGFPYDPQQVAELETEFGMHVGLTHSPFQEILEDTDNLIKKHKSFHCDCIGLGSMPGQYRVNNVFLVEQFIKDLKPATDKIFDAGLYFAYHNHNFEFVDRGGYYDMDVLFDKTNWNFVFDTGWADFAGVDVVKAIEKYASRLRYVHLKDFCFAKDEKESGGDRIVPIGYGTVPMDKIIPALAKDGYTKVAYVEQDNAVAFPDCYEQMRMSFDKMKEKGWI